MTSNYSLLINYYQDILWHHVTVDSDKKIQFTQPRKIRFNSHGQKQQSNKVQLTFLLHSLTMLLSKSGFFNVWRLKKKKKTTKNTTLRLFTHSDKREFKGRLLPSGEYQHPTSVQHISLQIQFSPGSFLQGKADIIYRVVEINSIFFRSDYRP